MLSHYQNPVFSIGQRKKAKVQAIIWPGYLANVSPQQSGEASPAAPLTAALRMRSPTRRSHASPNKGRLVGSSYLPGLLRRPLRSSTFCASQQRDIKCKQRVASHVLADSAGDHMLRPTKGGNRLVGSHKCGTKSGLSSLLEHTLPSFPGTRKACIPGGNKRRFIIPTHTAPSLGPPYRSSGLPSGLPTLVGYHLTHMLGPEAA